jgi:hypothetical protein
MWLGGPQSGLDALKEGKKKKKSLAANWHPIQALFLDRPVCGPVSLYVR